MIAARLLQVLSRSFQQQQLKVGRSMRRFRHVGSAKVMRGMHGRGATVLAAIVIVYYTRLASRSPVLLLLVLLH